jgi:hypothetical protein
MKQQEWELQSGLKFNMAVPESVDEFDKLPGGRVGLCLECATDDVAYRGFFADVRDILAEELEKRFPDCPRNRKPHPKDKTKTVLDESPGKYISRLAAELNLADEDGSLVKEFQPILDEIMTANAALPDTDKKKIRFSVEKVARTGGGGLVGKGDLEMATQWLKQDASTLASAIAKLSTAMGLAQPFVLPDGDDATRQRFLGLKFKEYRAFVFKQQLAAMTS